MIFHLCSCCSSPVTDKRRKWCNACREAGSAVVLDLVMRIDYANLTGDNRLHHILQGALRIASDRTGKKRNAKPRRR